jgi:hypothetical protein
MLSSGKGVSPTSTKCHLHSSFLCFCNQSIQKRIFQRCRGVTRKSHFLNRRQRGNSIFQQLARELSIESVRFPITGEYTAGRINIDVNVQPLQSLQICQSKRPTDCPRSRRLRPSGAKSKLQMFDARSIRRSQTSNKRHLSIREEIPVGGEQSELVLAVEIVGGICVEPLRNAEDSEPRGEFAVVLGVKVDGVVEEEEQGVDLISDFGGQVKESQWWFCGIKGGLGLFHVSIFGAWEASDVRYSGARQKLRRSIYFTQ